MKKLLRQTSFRLTKHIPTQLWWRMFYYWLRVLEAQKPSDSMRTLLAIDDVLTRQIDHTAIRYDNGVHVKHRLMNYHDFFVTRLQAGERVLDIGCGYGAVAYSMANRANAHVVGIDLDSGNIRNAQAKFQHPNLTFICGDALKTLPDEAFDTIVISNVLEHIEDRIGFLQQVQTSIHPHRWLIRVPMINRDWEVIMRRELEMYYYSDPTHFTEYTEDSFRLEMHDAGQQISHIQINWGEIWAETTAT